MTEQEITKLERDLKLLYQQIHLTVIYETDFIKKLESQKQLLLYRDNILDKINDIRRILKNYKNIGNE